MVQDERDHSISEKTDRCVEHTSVQPELFCSSRMAAFVTAVLVASLCFLGPTPRWPAVAPRHFSSSMRVTVSDPYVALGLPHGASDEQIKVAFRKSALKYHPDRHAAGNREFAEKKFKEISEAYELLSSTRGTAMSGSAAPSTTAPSPPPSSA